VSSSGAISPLAATFGRNLRLARQELNLSQHALAVKLGRGDAMTISRWERGEHKPNDENIVRVAAVLERDPSWFFEDRDGNDAPVAAA
jgi:transcriptional regulator with XRE-family HTH domain